MGCTFTLRVLSFLAHHRCGGVYQLYRSAGSAGIAVAWMSDEDVLPFEKEVALLREKLFEGRQIDNHIVCLNAAKVRVQVAVN